MVANVPCVCVGRFINDKLNYMYEFKKHPKLTEFIQEMANTGRTPREWTSFIETLNQALRIHDVVSSAFYCYPCDNCGRMRNDKPCIVCGND